MTIHPTSSGTGYLAVNPQAGIASAITGFGQVISGPWGAPFWSVDLRMDSWGRAGATRGWIPAYPEGEGPVLNWHGQGLTVEYINGEEGLRQNFLVADRPGGEGPLMVVLRAAGDLEPRLWGGDGLRFTDIFGNDRLQYSGLRVHDACGALLPAAFVLAQAEDCSWRITIEVEDAEASYPVLIDPVSTAPNRQIVGTQLNGAYGFAVSTAGDLNGDGYSDLVVGAPYMSQGESQEGLAFVYYGGPAGIGSVADVVLQSNVADANLGYSVACAGDLNGDGFSDLLVGAPNWESAAAQSDEGGVFVYYGSATGINSVPDIILQADATNKYMGFDVSGAGDLNGDGFSDIIVGGWLAAYGQGNEGAAWVFTGSATGLTNTPAHRLERNQGGAQFGSAVAGAGDINGDGYDDVVVGAYRFDVFQTDDGAMFVYYGGPGAAPLGPGTVAQPLNPAPAQTINSAGISRHFAWAVASAGDVNGDGYADVITGDWRDNIGGQLQEGTAMVFHGSATGLSTTPTTVIQYDQAGAWLGRSVSYAGDVNGDGYADVLIGAELWSETADTQGAAFLHLGSATGVQPVFAIKYLGTNSGANMGKDLCSAGDVNGDGYSDMVIGMRIHLYNGAMQVYHGGTYLISPPAGMPSTPATTLHPAPASGKAGWSVANAGDVNGDGYSDVLAGAPDASNGQAGEGLVYVYKGQPGGIPTVPAHTLEINIANAAFGTSVATAGDVNGDGYADVVVGAPNAGGTGRAYVYHGGPGGLIPVPALVLNGTAGSRFGHSVSTAGDINTDGYADLVVGAPDGGYVRVYLGGPGGLDPTPHTVIASPQPGSGFGWSVATAGDVNGDGYSDILIGAPFFTGSQPAEGAAFVYHGSLDGLVAPFATQLVRGQANARFGISVAGAGDVNGSGFSEVIVGADQWESGQAGEGGAFVFYGSASGTLTTGVATLQPNLVGAGFGASVAEGGDINGDGYADVVVGAPGFTGGQAQEGRVYVYFGRPVGISTSNLERYDPDQVGWRLGHAVAGGGDLDGDGFSDVIAGAPFGSSGPVDQGAVVMVRGNRAPTLPRPTRQYQADLVNPLSTNSQDYANPLFFGIGHFAKHHMGRRQGRLHWEVVFEGDAFSGTPITNSVASTAFDPAWTDLGTTGTELKHLVLKAPGHLRYKWRCRVEYPMVRAFDGQRFSRWFYGYASGHGDIGVMPLELVRFEGLAQERSNLLTWTTATENGTDHFAVERSVDGLSFSPIGSVPAAGWSLAPRDYAYLDREPPTGLAYYRLRMVDADGAWSLSPVVVLRRGGGTFTAWPNPAAEELRWAGAPGEVARAVVIDAMGRTVLDERVVGDRLSGPRFAALAPGTYTLLLAGADGETLGHARFQKAQAPMVR